MLTTKINKCPEAKKQNQRNESLYLFSMHKVAEQIKFEIWASSRDRSKYGKKISTEKSVEREWILGWADPGYPKWWSSEAHHTQSFLQNSTLHFIEAIRRLHSSWTLMTTT